MTNVDKVEERDPISAHDDDRVHRLEIVLPRARSIVWLGLKIYLLVVFVLPLVGCAVVLLLVSLYLALGRLS
jgi:hypothetical protein